MPSPLPGMNPYLEHPSLWPEVHSRLIVAIADYLTPQLRKRYRVAIEKRTYQEADDGAVLVRIPDVLIQRTNSSVTSPQDAGNVAVMTVPTVKPQIVSLPMPIEIKQNYLEIRDLQSGAVITAIELLSPTNKRKGKGRDLYEEKREEILATRTHLVEIDLLREGEPLPMFGDHLDSDYRILVSRRRERPQAELYGFNLVDPIPVIPIPVRTDEQEPCLDLQKLLHEVYDRAAYEDLINYQQNPVPPLAAEAMNWLDGWLREQLLR